MREALLSLDLLLSEQQDATAVDRFARRHDADELPPEVRRYRELIPHELPRPGQQYAFEVDLDACTGCKACVTGCHNLNGLDDGEVWRTVGLLHGGTAQAPAQQTVTSACHHCLEPACMLGCPVSAYEKDPVTGIVRHLDDQCIGCQYCIFMCPYDAPKYNARRGIVRKCDMCSDRLLHGEAPACVQSCPNEAIRVGIVAEAQVVEAAQASGFVPGAAGPDATLPTTLYQTERPVPRNLLPADFYAVNAEHSHPPLVAMLVLTQLSAGAFTVDWLARSLLGGGALRTGSALFALALGVAALGASLVHLGRPLYAFRAFLGLRTSWLSREIIGFSIFAALAAAYAGSFFVAPVARIAPVLVLPVAVAGALAVGCSVMVYAATRRECWRAPATALKFFGTAAVLGCATVMLADSAPAIARALCAAMALKLAYEASLFRHLRRRQHTALKRAAILMSGDLARVTALRFACGAVGGVLLPALVGFGHGGGGRAVGVAIFALTLAGELAERWLFFTAASAPKMPGGPA